MLYEVITLRWPAGPQRCERRMVVAPAAQPREPGDGLLSDGKRTGFRAASAPRSVLALSGSRRSLRNASQRLG